MIITETCSSDSRSTERRAVLKDLSLRMGVLYDLVVPFIDRFASSFFVHWHHGMDVEGDLILAVKWRQLYMGPQRRGNTVDERFYSDRTKSVEINFSEWVSPGRGLPRSLQVGVNPG